MSGADVFEEGLARGEVRFQACVECGLVRHPARWICPGCRSEKWGWKVCDGRGIVESFIWYPVRPEAIPDFALEPPYNVCVIRTSAGPALIANVVDVEPDQLAVGTEVEPLFPDPGVRAGLRFRRRHLQ